jgi:hypothetical protein
VLRGESGLLQLRDELPAERGQVVGLAAGDQHIGSGGAPVHRYVDPVPAGIADMAARWAQEVSVLAAWLRLSRRDEPWKTVEILILRHQLAVPQRHQPRRPKLNGADRALLAACSA